LIPTPPETRKDPVSVEVDNCVLPIKTLPPINIFELIPTPPETCNAPVFVVVESDVFCIIACPPI
jgi:hypothetical protein